MTDKTPSDIMDETMDEPQDLETSSATPMDRFIIAFGDIFSWVFLAAVAITAYEVVMRYVFNAPTIWVHELTIFLVSLGFTYSGLYAMARGTHIRINLVADAMPLKVQAALFIINRVLLVVYFVAAAYAAYLLAKPAVLGYESTGSAWNPHFPPFDKSFLILVMAALALQVALQLVVFLFRAFKGSDQSARHDH